MCRNHWLRTFFTLFAVALPAMSLAQPGSTDFAGHVRRLEEAVLAAQSLASLEAELNTTRAAARALIEERRAHDSNRCVYPEGRPEVCDAYNRAAEDLNRRSEALLAELARQEADLEAPRSRLSEAMGALRASFPEGPFAAWRHRALACEAHAHAANVLNCLAAEQERAARRVERDSYVDNGLIGGMTWTLGGYAPLDASPEVRAAFREQILQQAAASGIPPESIDLERYNFVLGLASQADFWLDLPRAIRDQDMGAYSTQHREAYASLRGRSFRELSCHSNGAMLCLAALRAGDVQVRDVVLYGPQITSESLSFWRQLLEDDRITSLRIVVNTDDAVPPLSFLYEEGLGAPSRRALLFNPDLMARTLREAIPQATVSSYGCNLGPRECHEMARYRAIEEACRSDADSRQAVAGTRGSSANRVPEPPRPGC